MVKKPRSFIFKDNSLGEDHISEFKTALQIEKYFENVTHLAVREYREVWFSY